MKFLFSLLLLTGVFSGSSVEPPEAFSVLKGTSRPQKPLSFDQAHPYGNGGFSRVGEEIVCDNGTNSTVASGASWLLRLDQKRPLPLMVTAESRAETEGIAGEHSLYLDVTYMDGTHLWGQKAQFKPLPKAGWQQRKVVLMPDRPIRHVSVYELFRHTTGRARFRAPVVHRLAENEDVNLFDTLVCTCDHVPTEPCFLLRDVAANSGFMPLHEQAKGLKLEVKEMRQGAATLFDVTLRCVQPADRAMTLVWTQPLPAGELVYFANPRQSEALSSDSSQRMDTSSPVCGCGKLSKWPFLAAGVAGKGYAVGMDPDAPAFFRTVLNARLRQLFIAFDLGFAPEKPVAHFKFCSFGFVAADGFRGALASYMSLFPETFKVRVPEQGLWMPFYATSKVKGWEDFGFKFKEGDGEIAWDDAHGLITFRYTEPTTWWMSITGKDGRKSATMAECIAEAERLAANGNRHAQAWTRGKMLDADGDPHGRILDTPWCNGIVWNVNSAPGQEGVVTDFGNKFGEPAFSKRFEKRPAGLDGEYVDSVEMYVTATLDFNRANFAGMRTPLCFDPDTHRPAVFKGLIGYEYVRELADRLHPIGRYTMANGAPGRWPWNIPYLDVTGTETNWRRDPSGWSPMSDDELIYRRALCGGKPYCFLMNTDFDKFSPEMVEKFMQRALAYGMFPGFFSPNASGGHYFSRPELYDRDRPLFKKYVPIVKKIAEAGWRPLCRVLACDVPGVYVEQFGDEGGVCYATVFNPSNRAVGVKLTSLRGTARELVIGGEWRLDGRQRFEIPAESVRVLMFAVKGGGSEDDERKRT